MPRAQERRSNMRHGNGCLVQAGYRGARSSPFKTVSPTHNDQTTVLTARKK